MPFSRKVKKKVLLWCARHCCLCGEPAGVHIEIAHLDNNNKNNDIDNAMPLCYRCHAAIGHYNENHPRGNKYNIDELKARRNQVYDQQTSQLLSPVIPVVNGSGASLPDVSFRISHTGSTYPLEANVTVQLFRGKQILFTVDSDHYNGKATWLLNPGTTYSGHFYLQEDISELKGRQALAVKITLLLFDIYGYKHEPHPTIYVLSGDFRKGPKNNGHWYLEPSLEVAQNTKFPAN